MARTEHHEMTQAVYSPYIPRRRTALIYSHVLQSYTYIEVLYYYIQHDAPSGGVPIPKRSILLLGRRSISAGLSILAVLCNLLIGGASKLSFICPVPTLPSLPLTSCSDFDKIQLETQRVWGMLHDP